MGGCLTRMIGHQGTPAPPLWQPDSLSSIKAWYVADDISGSNGTVVGSWIDREGNANASGATDPDTPSLVVPGLNGYKTIKFDQSVGGANQVMTMGTSFMVGETAGARFVIMKRVADPPAASVSAGVPIDGFSNAASSSHIPFTDGTVYDNFGTTLRKTTVNPTPSLTSWRLYSSHSGASDWRNYLDGTQLFSTATNTVNFGSGVTKQIGASSPGGSLYYDGQIAEIIIFNAVLTTSDRQKVEGYIMWKYGLQAQLPGGHPYLSAPP